MTKLRRTYTPYKRHIFAVSIAILLAILGVVTVLAQLPGSDFNSEDGNLVVDTGDTLDWDNVVEERQTDVPSGKEDDSFGQGSKEDTAVPAVVSGSIPPNKSDLKTFGIYVEETNGGKFLHMFWTRVQDPTGTTNMDFEFNQSSDISGNGVTPVRVAGDMLIPYELSKGGTVPNLFLLTWLDGSEGLDCDASNSFPCWGDRTDLTAAGGATGSINEVFIPAADSDGLGDLDPRTFGEASVDLALIFDPAACTSFGSAYLKSRSSDSFTAALKDFIAPQPVNISNCGTVIIRKETDPDGADGTFAFTTNVFTDPPIGGSFSLSDDGVETMLNVVAGGPYTVTELDPTPGFDLTDIDCDAGSIAPTVNQGEGQISFTMTVGGTVDCTFTNTQRGTIIVEKKTIGGVGEFDFTSTTLSPSSFSLTTTDEGEAGKVSKTFSNIVPGVYDVAEADPGSAWDMTSATCDDGSLPSAIGLEPGETVTCTFENTKRGSITIVKDATPDHEQDFLFTTVGNGLGDFTLDDDADGTNSNSITFSDLVNGAYSVTESAVFGWNLTSVSCDDDDSTGDTSTREASINLAPGEDVTCTFENSGTGNIIVKKETNPDGSTQSFAFTASYDGDGFSLSDGDGGNDSGPLDADTYSVSETPVAGWKKESATCDDDDGTDPASIVLDPGETVTCTFTNSTGAILISKTAKNYTLGAGPLAGAIFKVEDSLANPIGGGTTDENGEICVGGLVVGGEYTVTETDAPTNYALDDVAQSVTAAAAECEGQGTPTPALFVNDPLSEIVITFNSLAGNGVTVATSVSCTGPYDYSQDRGELNHGDSATFTNLLEGTYICTIVVDP